jgi:hypothetical protein
MSGNNSARAKLVRLADALVDDVIAAPVENPESDKKDIARARAIFDAVRMKCSKHLLDKAKSELEVWRTETKNIVASVDQNSSKRIFAKIREGDAEFNRKIMMAARNGEPPSEADIEGLANDYIDLGRLEKGNEKK